MTNPPTYTPGLGVTIMAYRLYMGLTRDTLAERMGMNPRSLERIEQNQRDCPPGLLDTLAEMVSKFEHAVDIAVDAINTAPHPVTLNADADEWTRAVYGRAAVETGRSVNSTL